MSEKDINTVLTRLKEKEQEAEGKYDRGEDQFYYADYANGYRDALADAINICMDIKEGN